MSSGEQGVILEVLNNPQAYGEETRRETHLKVIAELARLWRMEAAFKREVENLAHVLTRPA